MYRPGRSESPAAGGLRLALRVSLTLNSLRLQITIMHILPSVTPQKLPCSGEKFLFNITQSLPCASKGQERFNTRRLRIPLFSFSFFSSLTHVCNSHRVYKVVAKMAYFGAKSCPDSLLIRWHPKSLAAASQSRGFSSLERRSLPAAAKMILLSPCEVPYDSSLSTRAIMETYVSVRDLYGSEDNNKCLAIFSRE